MNRRRLIKMLTPLSGTEIRQFLTYVESPYFNRNEKLIKLAHYLSGLHPLYPEKKLSHEKLFQVMYGKSAEINEQQVYDHVSMLQRLLEDYLAFCAYEQDAGAKYGFLLTSLREKNLPKAFSRVFGKAENALLSDNMIPDDYLHLHLVQRQAEGFSGQSQNRSANQLLQDQITHLDIYYLSVKLRTTCEMLNRQNIIKTDYQSEMMQEIHDYFEKGRSPYLRIPFIAIYYQIFLTLFEPDKEAHYHQLAQSLKEYAAKLQVSEAYTMYAFAQNYCIKQINRGNPQFLQELFMLYQQLLKDGILFKNGMLAHEHYKNITTVGLRLREFDWVTHFLETYKSHLPEEVRENAYIYNLSTLYYEKKQYRDALKLLQQVDFADVYYHLGAKSVLLKVFYEMKDDDSLKYHIQAFKAFLKRNRRISAFHYEGHLNLLQMVSKVARIRRSGDRKDEELQNEKKDKLIAELNAAGNIPNAAWLRRQVEQL
ncbi:MAG: hypothetical protein R3C61_05380 [Bacteroidia bacterium]